MLTVKYIQHVCNSVLLVHIRSILAVDKGHLLRDRRAPRRSHGAGASYARPAAMKHVINSTKARIFIIKGSVQALL